MSAAPAALAAPTIDWNRDGPDAKGYVRVHAYVCDMQLWLVGVGNNWSWRVTALRGPYAERVAETVRGFGDSEEEATRRALDCAAASAVKAAETFAAAARALVPGVDSHPAPSPLPSDATVPAVHPASPEVTTTPGSASRPVPYPDGDKWCVRDGEDSATGVIGFGDTPDEALVEYDKAQETARLARGAP